MTTTTKRAKYKVCRRLGPGVYEKCQSEKFMLAESRKQKPVKRGRRGGTDFGRQLLEKQKVRFAYGIGERQFRNYVTEAMKAKGVETAARLYTLLEFRLDNVVFRSGLAPTRAAARQLVAHGHVMVNGKRIKVPSYRVKSDDVITVREGSQGKPVFEIHRERIESHQSPAWLVYDHGTYTAKLKGTPDVADASALYDFSAVLEFYSR